MRGLFFLLYFVDFALADAHHVARFEFVVDRLYLLPIIERNAALVDEAAQLAGRKIFQHVAHLAGADGRHSFAHFAAAECRFGRRLYFLCLAFTVNERRHRKRQRLLRGASGRVLAVSAQYRIDIALGSIVIFSKYSSQSASFVFIQN